MIEVALRMLPDFSLILAVDWLVDAGLDDVTSVAVIAIVDENGTGCLVCRSLLVVASY